MKKFTVIMLSVFMLMITATTHSFALNREEVKQILVNNAELLCEIAECNIANLDMEEMFLNSQLSTLGYVKESSTSKKNIEKAEHQMALIKRRLQDVHRLKGEKLEEFKQAKQAFENAKNLPTQ